jgi:hypothetical protein
MGLWFAFRANGLRTEIVNRYYPFKLNTPLFHYSMGVVTV